MFADGALHLLVHRQVLALLPGEFHQHCAALGAGTRREQHRPVDRQQLLQALNDLVSGGKRRDVMCKLLIYTLLELGRYLYLSTWTC